MEYYDNCFSLGCACATASSLSKLGLRTFSGPFDWVNSDFSFVMEQIDNEFIEFMDKKNMEIIADSNPIIFRDKKYNFRYPHEIKVNFEMEYEDVYNKYTRRAKRFIENIKKPTCFFRTIKTEDEISYIISHAGYIEDILKRYNDRNSIVYVLLNDIGSLPDNFRWFRAKEQICTSNDYRNVFDTSRDLLQFCETLLNPEQIKLNRKFDLLKYGQKTAVDVVNYYIRHDIDGIDQKLVKMFNLQSGESLYIWGAGRCGIPLYYYLMKRNIKIKAVIDNRTGKEVPSDILVVSPDDIEPCSKIFISVANELSNLEIEKQIKDKKCDILTYYELVHGIESS